MVASLAPKGAGRSASTRRCILVVEDEVLIRTFLAEELRDAGYDVVEASNADEALALLRSRAYVEAVVSDVRMPGSMDGIGLLKVVRQMYPQMPVIITSGHLQPTLATNDGATQFIPKPYSSEVIVKAVGDEMGKVE